MIIELYRFIFIEITNKIDYPLCVFILDVVHEPLDWKLVEQTNMALQQASDNLVQLYKRISLDHSLQENMRIQFLQKLVITADIAQQTLRPINPGSQSIMPNNMVKVMCLQ